MCECHFILLSMVAVEIRCRFSNPLTLISMRIHVFPQALTYRWRVHIFFLTTSHLANFCAHKKGKGAPKEKCPLLWKIHVLYSIVQPPGIRIHKHRLRGEARKLEREGGGGERGGKRRRERGGDRWSESDGERYRGGVRDWWKEKKEREREEEERGGERGR